LNTFKTYIPGLDEFFDGGLPSSAFLVMGVPGSGIEAFVREVSYRRASESNITYVSLNSPKNVIQQDMMEFGFDVSSFVKDNSLRIISDIDSDSVIDTVISEIKKNRSVVLDSLSDLLYEKKSNIAVDLMKSFSEREAVNLPHFLLLTEGMQDSKIEMALQHYADGVIHFTSLWEKDNLTRFITFRKLRGGFRRDSSIPYSLSDSGIIIETSLRIT
jgi:KaiC/GvpD/RAD55 family RecA-like ATPase